MIRRERAGWAARNPELAEIPGQEQSRKGTGHEDFAVGEVDDEKDPVDEGVAKGDQGIHRTAGDALDEEVPPYFPVVAPASDRGAGPGNGRNSNHHAEDDEDDATDWKAVEGVQAAAGGGRSQGSRSSVTHMGRHCTFLRSPRVPQSRTGLNAERGGDSAPFLASRFLGGYSPSYPVGLIR